MTQVDIEDALDLWAAAMRKDGADEYLIMAAMLLKALELKRGKVVTPTRQ